MDSAYLLVYHGSRDLRPKIAVAQLARTISHRLSIGEVASGAIPSVGAILPDGKEYLPLVATACLELAPRPLHQEIAEFAAYCASQKIDRVVIAPLFLHPGVHVMEDIPREIELARILIGDLVKLQLAPYFGSYPTLDRLFGVPRQHLPPTSILLAHGSRRAGGNERVEQLAQHLDLIPAYWSVDPSLADRVAALASLGAKEIGILPYFLFPGGITDAIAELMTQLGEAFPTLKLVLAQEIGSHPAVSDAIAETIITINN